MQWGETEAQLGDMRATSARGKGLRIALETGLTHILLLQTHPGQGDGQRTHCGRGLGREGLPATPTMVKADHDVIEMLLIVADMGAERKDLIRDHNEGKRRTIQKPQF